MPIPFLGILAVAGGLIGAGKVIDSMDTMDRAKSINREAKRIAEKASEKRDDAREATNKALAKLGKTKISIMAGNISRFAENYSRIKNIRLKDSAGLKELVDFDPNGKDFLEMKNAGFEAKELAAGGVGSIAVGAVTAAGAYSAVGMGGDQCNFGLARWRSTVDRRRRYGTRYCSFGRLGCGSCLDCRGIIYGLESGRSSKQSKIATRRSP